MIERKFVAEKIKEFQIQEFIGEKLSDVGLSHTKMQKTALGERIIIYAARPGLVVGRKGENIKKLTKSLKKKFDLNNPQIEIAEIPNINLDAKIIADRIAQSLERFGSQRFKGIGHQAMEDVMSAGALGVEILITGKVPSARAKRWRFYKGYLKKSGDIAVSKVLYACAAAQLKSGSIGIQVSIMPPDIELPDKVTYLVQNETPVAQAVEGASKETLATPLAEKPKKARKARAPRKKKGEEEQKETPDKAAEKKTDATPETTPAMPHQDSAGTQEAKKEEAVNP